MEHHDHSSGRIPPAGHAGMQEECDGSIDLSGKGSWKGHILPGSVFVLWGCFWAYSVCIYYLNASARRPYRARSWYPLGLRGLSLAEPILKVLVPIGAVSIELYWDHPAYRYLYCPAGSLHAGRFALTHMNNWQHTASYPAVVLSGLMDLMSAWVPFPAGTGHATLTVAFATMSFLMGTHEKHEPQDKMVHWLLFISMLICLAAILLEAHAPENPLSGFAKAAATLFQGAWLIQVGRIEFEDHPQWSAEYGGGAMFAPVAFCMIGVLVVACVAALYALLALLQQSGGLPSCMQPADVEVVGGKAAHLKCDGGDFDSAHNSGSDSGSPKAAGRGGMTPFSVMDGVKYTSARDMGV